MDFLSHLGFRIKAIPLILATCNNVFLMTTRDFMAIMGFLCLLETMNNHPSLLETSQNSKAKASPIIISIKSIVILNLLCMTVLLVF